MGLQFNRRKSHLTNRREETPPLPRGMKMTRWIYHAVLIGLGLFLANYALNRALHITATGFVAPERRTIRAEQHSSIIRMAVKPGQTVQQNELLFEARAVAPETPPDNSAPLERLRIERDLALKQAAAQALNLEISRKRQWLRQLQGERAQELYRDRNAEIRRQQSDLIELEARQAGQQAELSTLTRFYKSQSWSLPPPLVPTHTYQAPIAGEVAAIERQASEYVGEGQTVLTLNSATEFRLLAFFDQSDVNHLPPGKGVEIHLPDKTILEGTIQRFYSSAQAADLIWKNYTPLETLVTVEIELSGDKNLAAQRLAHYRQMTVVVKTRRWL